MTFEVLGRRLECRWIGPRPEDAPTIVFLHEGLGCQEMWRDFPDRMAATTGCGALSTVGRATAHLIQYVNRARFARAYPRRSRPVMASSSP